MELEQRSSEWHAFRSKRIGGSDAPIICGLSPWTTAPQLLEEKTGRARQPDKSMNFAVQRGIRLEPMVLGMAQIHLDCDLAPATLVHPEFPYMMASLDGWCEDPKTIVEIKVGGKADHDRLDPRDPKSIPKKYYPQLQHQMYVCEAELAYYVSYSIPKGTDETRGNLKIVPVLRDEEFLKNYLPLAEAFYNSLISGLPLEPARLDF